MNSLGKSIKSNFLDNPNTGVCDNCSNKTKSPYIEKYGYLSTPSPICDNCIKKEAEKNQKKLDEVAKNKEEYIKANYLDIAHSCGMPNKFMDIKKDDFDVLRIEVLRKVVLSLYKNYDKSFIFYGPTGIGKSMTGAFAFAFSIYMDWENYNKEKYRWTSLTRLNEKIRETISQGYNSDDTEFRILLHTCYIPKILVLEINDIKKEGFIYGGKQSIFMVNLFHKIVDHRWRNKKRTLYITALGKGTKKDNKKSLHEDLLKRYDDATIGRLFEDSQLVQFSGKDYRLYKQNQKSLWYC